MGQLTRWWDGRSDNEKIALGVAGGASSSPLEARSPMPWRPEESWQHVAYRRSRCQGLQGMTG